MSHFERWMSSLPHPIKRKPILQIYSQDCQRALNRENPQDVQQLLIHRGWSTLEIYHRHGTLSSRRVYLCRRPKRNICLRCPNNKQSSSRHNQACQRLHNSISAQRIPHVLADLVINFQGSWNQKSFTCIGPNRLLITLDHHYCCDASYGQNTHYHVFSSLLSSTSIGQANYPSTDLEASSTFFSYQVYFPKDNSHIQGWSFLTAWNQEWQLGPICSHQI